MTIPQQIASLERRKAELEKLQRVIDLRQDVAALEDVRLPGPHPIFDAMLEIVCNHYRVTRREILSMSRCQPIVFYRQVAMAITRTVAEESLSNVGRYYLHRDHGTVLHAIHVVQNRRDTNSAFRAEFNKLSEKCAAAVNKLKESA